jgi:predicted DNA-binding WGR domain protein
MKKATKKKATTGGGVRRFEFVMGTSKKFWEISRSGTLATTHWGRIGTEGQSKEKRYATAEKAQTECDKLVGKKIKKGYVETSTEGASAKPPAEAGGVTAAVRDLIAEHCMVLKPDKRKKWGEKALRAKITSLEEEVGFDLPADYCAFLAAWPHGVAVGDDPSTEEWQALHKPASLDAREYNANASGALLIGRHGGGFGFAVMTSDDGFEYVTLDLESVSDGAHHLYGTTFEAFLTRMLEVGLEG